MFKNYFRIAFRSLWRNKAFAAINILGLSIGIATCLLIMVFVTNELSYDRFNKKADRIVRVVFRGVVQGEAMREANVMPPVAQTLQAEFPEVQEATRLRNAGTTRITYGDKSFKEDPMAFADSNFFHVFTLPFVQGDPGTALIQPGNVVLSESIAAKYFGKEDPMGKTLNFPEQKTSYKVAGIIRDIPVNAHFHFGIFLAMSGLQEAKEPTWLNSNFHTYLVLAKGYDSRKLEAKLPQIVEKYLGPQFEKSMGVSMSDFRKKGNDLGLYLQPLTDIHLHSDLNFELEPGGDVRQVYIFGAIALFMLAIACINFVNLSTAGASKRAREVGVRKVLGSLKSDLIRQFLVESVILAIISMSLAILLVKLSMPLFNSLSGKALSFDLRSNWWFLPGLLVLGVFVGVLAGSYPAFFLSSFNPISVLKGKSLAGKSSAGLRSGLVVFQFFVSVSLIIGTIVVYEQLSFIHHKQLGYNKDQVLVLPGRESLGKNLRAFRDKLLQDPRVANVSTSGYLPAGPSYNNNFFVFPDNNKLKMVKTLRYETDEQYIPTLGMEMTVGRNFSTAYGSDSAAIILNETAAKALGWGSDAIGHSVSRSNDEGQNRVYHVIGIIKDFHFRSLHERISPLVITMGDNSGAIIVKVKTRDVSGLLSSIRKQWALLAPGELFDYSFLDERYNNTYQTEQKMGLILGIFACLTIFVACMGLFGLAMFTAQQRTREIGIRKVIGASVSDVVTLLSKDFLRLVILGNLLAWPLAWYGMHKWLSTFAYRIDLSWWTFLLAGALAVLISLATVAFQAVKTALINPVISLKSE